MWSGDIDNILALAIRSRQKMRLAESRRKLVFLAGVIIFCFVLVAFVANVCGALFTWLRASYQFDQGAQLILHESLELLNSSFPLAGRANDIVVHIHQMWKNEDVSTYPHVASMDSWKSLCVADGNCIYHFWTDEKISQLLFKHHPGLGHPPLPLPIQVADLARWLILYEYGGMYVDLDANPTRHSLRWIRTLLKTYPILMPTSTHGGDPGSSLLLSNHVLLVGEPRNPLVDWIIHNLAISRDNPWLSPIRYLRVMSTTGSIFLTKTVHNYLLAYDKTSKPVLGVLHPRAVGLFVQHAAGRSWHAWDGRLIMFVGETDLKVLNPWVVLLGLVTGALLLTYWSRRGRSRGRMRAVL